MERKHPGQCRSIYDRARNQNEDCFDKCYNLATSNATKLGGHNTLHKDAELLTAEINTLKRSCTMKYDENKRLSKIIKRIPVINKITSKHREEIWKHRIGERFNVKCPTPWCTTIINPFSNWHSAHMIAKCKGGSDDISNMTPVCAKCNLSMQTTSWNDWINT